MGFVATLHCESGSIDTLQGSLRSRKSLESSGICSGKFQGLEKLWKSLEESLKTVMLTWKVKMFITLVIMPAFVNFPAFRETNHQVQS